jgi:molybdopterin synthase sulfur carrier subunit
VKVHVRFFSQLRDLVGKSDVEIELPAKATVTDLMEQIYRQTPMLRAHDKSILVGIGVEFVDRKHELNSGDEVAIMPPVQGG